MEKHPVSALCTEEGHWWLEVVTDEPYLYLFGPFETTEEVNLKSSEYFNDLTSEGWKIASSKITQIGPPIAFEKVRQRLEFQAQFSE